ncbi:Plastid division protein PDV2 [Acorus gramineus]|uniref:Plastid division protein PDV2 n=1 Tax=Acorus gramineus TaxID=55184 RepID=A0AAV9B079_ACOGR|nr:Plastid division protein PDV2 [Acorus gramineus]
MESEEKIGLVLSRVSELRSKINGFIERSPCAGEDEDDHFEEAERGVGDEDDDNDDENLVGVRDALESLEKQIASFQALHQQQRYERETTLAQIERSRIVLLNKAKEYNGEDIEVIHEISAFASEKVEPDEDLFLPPYPSCLLDAFVLDDLLPSHIYPRRKSSEKETSDEPLSGNHKSVNGESENKQSQNANSRAWHIFGFAAKAVLTIMSMVSVLSLAGFEPRLGRKGAQTRVSVMFPKRAEEEQAEMRCPPGKFLVIEDGKPRCLVKERIEVPFEPAVTAPSISYGFG